MPSEQTNESRTSQWKHWQSTEWPKAASIPDHVWHWIETHTEDPWEWPVLKGEIMKYVLSGLLTVEVRQTVEAHSLYEAIKQTNREEWVFYKDLGYPVTDISKANTKDGEWPDD